MTAITEFLKTNIQGTIILAFVTFFLALIQIFLTYYLNVSISKKLERQKATFSKEIEAYRFSNALRKEQAEKVAELFARIRYNKSINSTNTEEQKQLLNQKIWELTLWLPTNILEELYCLIDDTKADYKSVLVQIRNYLNINEKGIFELDSKKIKDFK